MDTKKRWEELLNPERFRPKTSPAETDKRDDFENDYARLISSSPIRRLQDKTQVFPLEKSDFIRTRLTHSLEVSAIARSIGKSIERDLEEKDEIKKGAGISNLLACAGLIHDLGNTPYGHFGETAIQDFFTEIFNSEENKKVFIDWNDQMRMDFVKFDGNVQTLRILLKLQFLGDEYSFNLSFPTLASIIKYPRKSNDGNKKSSNISEKKFGYFFTEQEKYDTINETLKLHSERHPVTFLLESADDIAYSAADIEDGVKLGILDFEIIISEFENYFATSVDNTEVQKEKFEKFKTNYLEFQKENVPGALDIAVQKFRIDSQGIMINAILKEFIASREQILSGTYNKELLKSSEASAFKDCFKRLSLKVFASRNIVEKELSGYVVIHGLLKEYINSALNGTFSKGDKGKGGRLYNLVSSSYRYIYEKELAKGTYNPLYLKFQLITDFIAGMTDTYALELYRRISGIR